jgi:hypothetical protein
LRGLLEGNAMPSHLLHSTFGGENFARGGVHIYVSDGTARWMRERGYESITAPNRSVFGSNQARLIGHHHIAHALDQPAVGLVTGRTFVYGQADVLAEEIIGKIGHLFDDRRGQHAEQLYD